MDLKKKLAYYKSANTQPKNSTGQQQADGVNPSLKALADHFRAEIQNQQTPYLKITKHYSLPDSIKKDDPVNLRFLSKNQVKESIALHKCLFFDLETTGLAGGAGTFAFLLGFGYFEKDQLVVEQYFLPDYGREYYLFKILTDFFKRFEFLISYNGKSYDLPLLRNRFILNQQQSGLEKLQHIDLLHIARRIWKNSFPACNLITLEQNLLNRHRKGDIPGALIPQAYFDFIKTGVIHDVTRMIDHNYLDIVSLAELLMVVNEIEKEPQAVTDKKALLRLAGLAFELNDYDVFEATARALTNGDSEEPPQLKIWQSLMLKKMGNWEAAAAIWEQLISVQNHTFFALEELAKYREHVAKDLTAALAYTNKALNYLELLTDLNPYQADEKVLERFRHRKRRLLSKLA